MAEDKPRYKDIISDLVVVLLVVVTSTLLIIQMIINVMKIIE